MKFLELLVTFIDDGWNQMSLEQKVLLLSLGASILQHLASNFSNEVEEEQCKTKSRPRKS